MISLAIRNRTNIHDGFKGYVASENLSGVQCDACGIKTETKKRDVINQLPNTLIIHLKRFELNFETWRNEKVNSRFEFPIHLNVEPYTREGLQRIEMEEKVCH